MKQEAMLLFNNDYLIWQYATGWQEQQDHYTLDSDFDLFCSYLCIAV